MNELYDYIVNSAKGFSKYVAQEYGLDAQFSEKDITNVYNTLLTDPCDFEEKKRRIDQLVQNALENQKIKIQNERARNGDYSNFDQILEVINIISHSPLVYYTTFYGGNIPYLLTGERPKRIIGDVDMGASIEEMDKIREYINSNPDIFEVVLDSKEYTDKDYGMELRINGIDVTIFTHEDTPNGRIVRNFKRNQLTGSIDVKGILFPGIHDSDITIETEINGAKIKLECPEYVYIQKCIADRDKDRMDIEVLNRNKKINADKLRYIKEHSEVPKTVELKSVSINNKKYETSK